MASEVWNAILKVWRTFLWLSAKSPIKCQQTEKTRVAQRRDGVLALDSNRQNSGNGILGYPSKKSDRLINSLGVNNKNKINSVRRNKTIIVLKKLLFLQIFCKWLFWTWKMGRMQYIHILDTKHNNKFNDLYMDWEERTEDKGGKKKGWEEEETAFWISQATQHVFREFSNLASDQWSFPWVMFSNLTCKTGKTPDSFLTEDWEGPSEHCWYLLAPSNSDVARYPFPMKIPAPSFPSIYDLPSLSFFFTFSLAVEFEMNLTPT